MTAAIIKKLQSDADLRRHARAFLEIAFDASAKTDEEVRQAWESMRFRMQDEVYFRESPALRASERALMLRAVKLLGPQLGSEADVSSAIWVATAKLALNPSERLSDDVATLVAALVDNDRVVAETVFGAGVVRLEDDVPALVLGPVHLERAEQAFDAIKASGAFGTAFVLGEQVSVASGALVLPHTCWRVETTSAPSNAREEALWLIDVAISLIRILHADHPQAAGLGDTERAAVLPRAKSLALTRRATGLSLGANSVVGLYRITQEAAAALQSEANQAWVRAIFDAKPSTLGARVHAALGWLTRGRASASRSERLLFFFTALEAMLASSDKSAPVTDTIARHVASILAEDVGGREKIIRDIKRLYDIRSALVHRGARDSSLSSANSVHMFTEHVLRQVITCASPDQSEADFLRGLQSASYGLSWPISAPDEGVHGD